MPHEPHDTSSFELAERYAEEMSAQFKTLNLFVSHAGEVGRSHEVFLAQVLARFLPEKLRIGTGFVYSPKGATRQQDIIVYDWQSLPLPLKIGDCVVVDAAAVAAMIEVKTRIRSTEQLREGVDKIAQAKSMGRGPHAVGLYAWDGLGLETAIECYWSVARDAARTPPRFEFPVLPDFAYVRGRYLLTPNLDGRIESPPLRVMRLGDGHASEGLGLLALLDRLWLHGIQHCAERPWWLEAWSQRERQESTLFELVPWPEDLQERADERAAEG